MSRREHGVLRMGALLVLALCAWIPRGALSGGLPSATAEGASSTVVSSATVSRTPRPAAASRATFASVALTESR